MTGGGRVGDAAPGVDAEPAPIYGLIGAACLADLKAELTSTPWVVVQNLHLDDRVETDQEPVRRVREKSATAALRSATHVLADMLRVCPALALSL